MSVSQLSSLEQGHSGRGVAGTAGAAPAVPACVGLRGKLIRSWRMRWLRCSGTGQFGRIAAGFAAWGTTPYHSRAFLADMTTAGFIAPKASVSHHDLRLGKHVYLGDNVIVSGLPDGGEVRLDDRVQLYGNTFVETGLGAKVHIGESTHIQPGCHIHAMLSDITIGKSVEIAADCAFYSYNHGMALGRPIMEQPLESKGGISIGDGAWLGHRVTVLQGVNIGAGAVIAAGSVVTRDIPENAIAAGVPAKVISHRS